MSRVPPAVRVAIGAAAAVGAGLAVEKAVVRRLRKRKNPEIDPLLTLPGDGPRGPPHRPARPG